MANKLAYALCATYVIVAAFYAFEKDWWKALYWFSAALINVSVTSMGTR